MNIIDIYTPHFVLGNGCVNRWIDEMQNESWKKIVILSVDPLWVQLEASINEAESKGLIVKRLDYKWKGEPTTDYFDELRREMAPFAPDVVMGVGGGSVLDLSKLLAALGKGEEKVEKFFGKNLLPHRNIGLFCMPTTAGTGSEMSPNAILLDAADGEKKAVISRQLLPDCVVVDPDMTLSLPPKITAETGMDALCHCVEAYMNKHSHQMVDTPAVNGIVLICRNLVKACRDGRNRPAREGLSVGAMLGGMCLGPVNTCGVHALSYGLAGKYHISHGLANAILLPEVMRFNKPTCISRFSYIARRLDLPITDDYEKNAEMAIDAIQQISIHSGIPQHLSEIGIKAVDIPEMADMAMRVTRLLENNPREITREDAIRIYENVF